MSDLFRKILLAEKTFQWEGYKVSFLWGDRLVYGNYDRNHNNFHFITHLDYETWEEVSTWLNKSINKFLLKHEEQEREEDNQEE